MSKHTPRTDTDHDKTKKKHGMMATWQTQNYQHGDPGLALQCFGRIRARKQASATRSTYPTGPLSQSRRRNEWTPSPHSRTPAALHVRLLLDRGHKRAQHRVQLRRQGAGAGVHRRSGRRDSLCEHGLPIVSWATEEVGISSCQAVAGPIASGLPITPSSCVVDLKRFG